MSRHVCGVYCDVPCDRTDADGNQPVSGANSRQIGGDHYKKHGAGGGEQHWDRVWRLFGPGYFIGCATKYIERYQDKNGVQDLEKAKHFIEKLIELETAKAQKPS